MKGRNVLAFFLSLLILGGLSYIGWSLLGTHLNNQPPSGNHEPMPSNPHQANHNQTHPQQPAPQLSALASSNQDALNEALTILNQALEQITIDPYSRTTVPNLTLAELIANRASQGTGTINIYPNGNSSVNLNPTLNGNNRDSNPNPANPNLNFVFDQNKLYQLHQRIFMLAQGMMQIDNLNADLTNQAELLEANPPDYATYLNRYNLTVQNKSKLTGAINLLNQAFTLVNINPYAHPLGFQYNVQNMEQLHQGIFKLSQAMMRLNQLNARFSQQISVLALQLQQSPTAMPLQHGTGIDFSSIIGMVLILIILALIISVLIGIGRMLKANATAPEPNPPDQPD